MTALGKDGTELKLAQGKEVCSYSIETHFRKGGVSSIETSFRKGVSSVETSFTKEGVYCIKSSSRKGVYYIKTSSRK